MKFKFENLVVSYGSNTNPDDLNEYARRQGYLENHFYFEAVVKVPDYKLAFDTFSKNRGGGVLNIQPAIGHVTEAGLFSTDEIGLSILRKKEGVPFKYEEKPVIVLDYDGTEIAALTYIVKPELRRPFFAPSNDYLQICEEGYKLLEIDTYNLHLAATNEQPQPVSALFSYGTFQRGEERFPVIRQYGLSCALTAFCFGNLSTNGKFPALDLMGEGFSRGDYFRSDNIEALLKQADIIEGFESFGSNANLFRRTCVDVDVGGVGQREAWIYVMDTKLDTKLPNNDWRAFKGSRRAFSAELVKEHSSKVEGFYEGVTENYFRFGRVDGKTAPLSQDEIIELLLDEQTLTERTMAQVSNCWTALTNTKEGTV